MVEELTWFQGQSEVIAAAPWPFIGIAVMSAAAGWGIANWALKERLETVREALGHARHEIDVLKAESAESKTLVDDARRILESQVNPGPYRPAWKKLDEYRFWHAAWLWVGAEPVPRVPDGTPAYPILQLLKQAAKNEKINVSLDGDRDSVNVYAIVKRDALKAFAQSINESPEFLAD